MNVLRTHFSKKSILDEGQTSQSVFELNTTMRSMFGQRNVSLDLRKALDKGSIILVSLATERAKVSRENSELFATLLLSDLWTVTQARGKLTGNFYAQAKGFLKIGKWKINPFEITFGWKDQDLGHKGFADRILWSGDFCR